MSQFGALVEAWIDRYLMSPHVFPFSRVLPEPAKKAVKEWFKENDPLDYEVFGPAKQYKPKKKPTKKAARK